MAAAVSAPPLECWANNRSPSTIADHKSPIVSQVSIPHKQAINLKKRDLLVVSPYLEEHHQLDLSTLDTPNQLLAKALVNLKFTRDDHRTAPYVDSFNWPDIVDAVRALAGDSGFNWKKSDFYIVVFRSRIPPTTVYSDLGVLDKAAHVEATASGGFLKYKFSTPDVDGRNLATCVWRNQHDARIGSVGEAHRAAAGATRLLYTEWKIERLKFTIHDDVKSWEMVQWVD